MALAKGTVTKSFSTKRNTMKKIMLAACLIFGGGALVNAQVQDQSTTPTETQPTQDQDKDRQPISVSELPQAVKTSLESQDFAGWTVGNAYKKIDTANDNKEMYIVELKKGAETKDVKFDAEGNKLDDEKTKDDQK
jgi:hypothetical protein